MKNIFLLIILQFLSVQVAMPQKHIIQRPTTHIGQKQGSTASAGKTTKKLNKKTQPANTKQSGRIVVPQAVDLGLSVRWASFNLGASKPEGYGNYYAWGETKPKSVYLERTYKFAKGGGMTKYSTGYKGFNDGKTSLESIDDAATVNLGRNWRLPTKEEIIELYKNCKREWVTVNVIKGMRFIGPSGQSIFLPATGRRYWRTSKLEDRGIYGQYWTSSLADYGWLATSLVVVDDGDAYWSGDDRPDGFTIRPVYSE